jgi:LacI family gluconate utilization system Gnt-I transcriptional repressor
VPPVKEKNLVTMRDVARAAGVSRMTVSRALKKDSPVSKDTREHILRVVREMNYVPDQMAGSLTTKRSGFVAVLVPSLNNLHFAETVQALTEELDRAGMQLLLGYTNYDPEQEEKQVETMLGRRPEAIVLSYDGHTKRTVELLQNANVPVIELWERPADPIQHTIGFSNRLAAERMTWDLLKLGYQEIVFLAEAGDDWTRGAQRRAGYGKAMADAGLPERIFQTGRPPMSIEDGADAMPRLLQTFPKTDCIFCVSDAAAFGALSGLKALGVKVPDEIGVAGFGNFEISRFASPMISTVDVDSKRIGRAAGRLIADLLDEEESDSSARQIDVDPVSDLRDSTKRIK